MAIDSEWLELERAHTIPQVDVPKGAKDLGCRNCRVGDRHRHPHLGLVYCAVCPVVRMAKSPEQARRLMEGQHGDPDA